MAPKPPIPDPDGDKKLTIKDILAALKAEDAAVAQAKANGEKIPSQPAHDLMHTLYIAQPARDLYKQLLSETPTIQQAAMNNFVTHSKQIEDSIKHLLKLGESAKNKGMTLEALMDERAAANKLDKNNPEYQKLISSSDFVATFAKTFPKGIAIEAKDLPSLYGYFSPPATPTYGSNGKEVDNNTQVAMNNKPPRER